MAAILGSQRFCQRVHAALAGGVGRPIKGAFRARDRTHVDDRARLLFNHVRQHGLAAPQRRVQGARQFKFDLLLAVLRVGLPPDRAANVVDEHVDPAKRGNRLLHELLSARQFADVDNCGNRFDAVALEVLGGRKSGLFGPIRDDDAASLRAESHCGGAAYSLPSSGHDADLAPQPLCAGVQRIEFILHCALPTG